MIGKKDHEEVDALLPWFVNGSLSARQERRVLSHLRDCADCRVERDRLQDLQQFVLEEDEAETGDYRFAFRKLMSRIDAHEANVESARDVRPVRGWQAGYFAVAACLVASLAFVIALNPSSSTLPEDGFETLTTPPPSTAASPRRISLTFEEKASSDMVRTALIESRSSIIAGPDETGTYTVEIEVPESVAPEEFLGRLGQIEGVRFAAFEDVREEQK